MKGALFPKNGKIIQTSIRGIPIIFIIVLVKWKWTKIFLSIITKYIQNKHV